MSAVGTLLLKALSKPENWRFGFEVHKHLKSDVNLIVKDGKVGRYTGAFSPVALDDDEHATIIEIVKAHHHKVNEEFFLTQLTPPTKKLPE